MTELMEDLSINARIVFDTLRNKAEELNFLGEPERNYTVTYSLRSIAEAAGLTRYYVEQAVEELRTKGYITIEARYLRLSNRYHLVEE